MVHGSTGTVALIDDVDDVSAFDEKEFELDLRVIDIAYPIGKLSCDTSDGCGSTCSGSACNSEASSPF